MYAIGVRYIIIIAILFLIFSLLALATSTPSGAVEVDVVGEAGPFDVYRVGDDVFYAAIDSSNFDYIYDVRLYVVRYYSVDDMAFRFALIPFLWSLIGEEAGLGPIEMSDVDIVYPRPGVEANELVDELRSKGVEAVAARVLAIRDSRVFWVEVVVPSGVDVNGVLARSGLIKETAGKYVGDVDINFVIVIEGLWPSGMEFKDLARLGEDVLDVLASRDLPLRGVGGAYGLPLVFSVDGVALEERGLAEEEVLKAIEETLPSNLKAVVEIHYYKESFLPDVEGEESDGLLRLVPFNSDVVILSALVIALLGAFTGAFYLYKAGRVNLISKLFS